MVCVWHERSITPNAAPMPTTTKGITLVSVAVDGNLSGGCDPTPTSSRSTVHKSFKERQLASMCLIGGS